MVTHTVVRLDLACFQDGIRVMFIGYQNTDYERCNVRTEFKPSVRSVVDND